MRERKPAYIMPLRVSGRHEAGEAEFSFQTSELKPDGWEIVVRAIRTDVV
jgi:hypothetical protein